MAGRKGISLVLLTCIVTNTVLANAGMGLLEPGLVHLIFGNIVIGLVESFFVKIVFKIRTNYAVIILGNFVSTFIGYVLISIGMVGGMMSGDNYTRDVLQALPILFVVSALVEWPFFVWAAKPGVLSFTMSSFKYAFYAQCVSYVLLVPFYLNFDPSGMDEGSRDAMINDLNNIAAHAYHYRIRPVSMQGGEGSYIGYAIPPKMSTNANGFYSCQVSDSTVTITVFSARNRANSITAQIDSEGRFVRSSWTYTGDFQ